MKKTPEGPVIWQEDKCMGCRFCMISCPFDIPKFEYDAVVPDIEKCRFCLDRIRDGEQPACTEACPEEAIVFGKRRALIEEARGRIHEAPDEYQHHLYGEHEAGGTSWLYLSAVPFEELGFRTDLGEESYPAATTDFLYSVPIILTLWPAFLLALNNATKPDDESEESEA
jgi:ferredoxin